MLPLTFIQTIILLMNTHWSLPIYNVQFGTNACVHVRIHFFCQYVLCTYTVYLFADIPTGDSGDI